MISPETTNDILEEISHSLSRIADALEIYNGAAIRGYKPNESDGQIELFVTSHEL